LALLFYSYDFTKKSVKNQNRWDIWHKSARIGGEGRGKLFVVFIFIGGAMHAETAAMGV
jgi:hypothetical protein